MTNGSTDKSRFVTQIELSLKLATAVLGGFYVLGLLISNAQLMELGISDFSSLQARNIMIGFSFLIYLATLLVLLMIVSLVVGISLSHIIFRPRVSWPKKVVKCLTVLATGSVIVLSAAYFVGSLIGFEYAGGRPWIAGFEGPWWPPTLDLIPFEQFSKAYFHPKIIVFSLDTILILIVAGSIVLIRSKVLADSEEVLLDSDKHQSLPNRIFQVIRTNWQVCVGSVALIVWGSPLVLFDYADEVYPNVKYNVGGGQPQVAELILTGKEVELTSIPGVHSSCAGSDKDQAIVTYDVALWYQSDKFVYLSSLTNDAPSLVTAIDIKLVRSIHYLSKYVTVSSGGRIVSVHSY